MFTQGQNRWSDFPILQVEVAVLVILEFGEYGHIMPKLEGTELRLDWTKLSFLPYLFWQVAAQQCKSKFWLLTNGYMIIASTKGASPSQIN